MSDNKKTARFSFLRFIKRIGPGIITGASDDDPSGIATYSQAGAVAGLSLLWTALFTTPLMISIQEMCARIGLVTGKGLTGVLHKHYPKPLLYVLASLVVLANTLNIGADIAGMSAATYLVLPLPLWMLGLFYSMLVIALIIFTSYQTFTSIMKWLVFSLFLYLIVPFLVRTPWLEVLRSTIIPTITMDRTFFTLLVAILGTTISPYLFFWQAALEVEDKKSRLKTILQKWIVTKNELKVMRQDVTLGMIISNVVMWFIILTTGITLFTHGITNITTAQQAAEALRPIAGDAAYAMFMLGIVGTGLLAIPVLAGSSSYVLAEAFGWDGGLNLSFHKAKKFYIVTVCSTLVGVVMTALGVNPITTLLYTAVIYGLISPPLIAVIMHIANNKKIMGTHTNSVLSNVFGSLAFVVMTAAGVLFIVFSVR